MAAYQRYQRGCGLMVSITESRHRFFRLASLDTVVRTAQSLVRHGLGHRPEGGAAEVPGSAVRKPRPRKRPAPG